MGLFDSIKKAIGPLHIHDPFFGSLRYQKVGFWEGKKQFAPLGREIEFTLDASEEGASEDHRKFYRDLEARYPELARRFEPLLLNELREWLDEPFTGNVWDEFELESYGIPNPSAQPQEWELIYTSKSAGHYFCMLMQGWETTGIRVDG